ncbi:expressed unknown protein [Seminavis robusta]|uniref:Uncharacterized protein n=1 Tax=Seminavis robusta TaxID=568900 RepID=A0A9N8EUH5_9STRA|nr:expressed unknown protein [Seminavis robusta]|eukprot:Sro1987_g309570.1 n/a (359) ;mRNA; f:11993-13069
MFRVHERYHMTTLLLSRLILALLGLIGVSGLFDGLPQDYESWTAEEKFGFWDAALEDELLENADKSPSDQSGNFPSTAGKVAFLTTDDFSPTFERFRDDLPYTHAKRIRSVGGVGLVTWHPTVNATDDNPFTGFFATGAPYALIRLSYTSPNDDSGTTPGLSLKLFRDGMPSSNMLAMESLEGQTSGNFFEFDFSNHLKPATTALLRYVGHRFSQYSCPSTRTGLSEVALSTESIAGMQYDVHRTIQTMNFPFKVIFRPNPTLTQQFASYPPEGSLFDILTAIEVGTTLYDIYAVADPELMDQEIHVGHLELTRKLQPSVLGDKVLFFRHQKIEEDYALRPHYNAQDEGTPRCPAGYR